MRAWVYLVGLAACTPVDRQAEREERAAWLATFGNDPKAIDNKFGSSAQGVCSSRANDYLRTIALNDFKWDDDANGLLGTKFDKISLRSAGANTVTLISGKAKVSNAFGAFSHISLYCVYNALEESVVTFALSDPAVGELPPSENSAPPGPITTYTPPEADNQADNATEGNVSYLPAYEPDERDFINSDSPDVNESDAPYP